MRIPTLAACALAALAVQDQNQPAIANPTGPTAQPKLSSAQRQGSAIAVRATPAIVPPESLVSQSPDAGDRVPTPTSGSARSMRGEAIAPPHTSPILSPERVTQAPPTDATPISGSVPGAGLPASKAPTQKFILPIRVEIATNPSVTSDTPITDQEFPNPLPPANVTTLEQLARYREARTAALSVWAEQIRECLASAPKMIDVADNGSSTPVWVNGKPGRIVKNANGRLVCPP